MEPTNQILPLNFRTSIFYIYKGKSLYISSNKSPLRKALLTSSCVICQLLMAAIARRVLIATSLATGENISLKSNPSCWVYPLATKRALYLSMLPSDLYFILQIHLQPIEYFSLGSLLTDWYQSSPWHLIQLPQHPSNDHI